MQGEPVEGKHSKLKLFKVPDGTAGGYCNTNFNVSVQPTGALESEGNTHNVL